MDKSTRILVVDDDPDLLELTSEILRRAGYEVLEASTGKECLEAVRAHHPDLVLLDVVLPDVTGVQVCKQIKGDQQLRGTLVILISGLRVSSDYQADALNVGADGYIVKPISNKELLARVQAMERIKRAEEALQASEVRYRRLFETAQDGILILDGDTGEIDDVNPFLIGMLGYTREELLGKKLWEIGLFKDAGVGKAAFGELHDKGFFRFKDLPLETKFGREIAVECISNVHDVDSKKVIQCNIRDITERKRLEERLQSMSLVDDLTGLYNRRGFFALAQQQLTMAKRTVQEVLLFFVDLDNMKQINDALGHQEGDNALIEVASVLKETFRESDIISRLGGDEFAVLAIDVTHETENILMNRLQKALEACNRLKPRKYTLSLSTGVAHYEPESPSSLDELIARADALMYEKKRTKQRAGGD
ncbi:MAG: diguanylate cyclase [Syntrophorhabdales bacterium]|jgi:diguanylate cyclase (GGDEF)-like protein/PAS domain S-box-containing protein